MRCHNYARDLLATQSLCPAQNPLRTKETFENLEAFPNMIAGRMGWVSWSLNLYKWQIKRHFAPSAYRVIQECYRAGKSGPVWAVEAHVILTLGVNA
jgi:hypothetical protein